MLIHSVILVKKDDNNYKNTALNIVNTQLGDLGISNITVKQKVNKNIISIDAKTGDIISREIYNNIRKNNIDIGIENITLERDFILVEHNKELNKSVIGHYKIVAIDMTY